MKTGFINTFAKNKINWIYDYHGITEICYHQPDSEPVIDYEMIYGPEWEFVLDAYWVLHGIVYQKHTSTKFLPSSDKDVCTVTWPDKMKRYYFCEVEYYRMYSPVKLKLVYNNGEGCNLKSVYGNDKWYMYKSWVNNIWKKQDYLYSLAYPGKGSHGKLWRSTSGELPSYTPVKVDFYLK